MKDAEMDESFYDKLKERKIKWELPAFRPMPIFDTDKARAGFEQAAKEAKEKELLDLRDHFAGLAMQSLMPIYWDTIAEYSDVRVMMKSHVEAAYEYADAMLKQRSLTND